MNRSANLALQPGRDSASYAPSAREIAENALPWIAGIYAVMVPFVYREILRLMLWARSMNW